MKCKGKTHEKRWPYHEGECSRDEWKDGYCKTHHPAEKLKRSKQRNEERDRLYKSRDNTDETASRSDAVEQDELWDDVESIIAKHSDVDDVLLFAADSMKVFNELKEKYTIFLKSKQ